MILEIKDIHKSYYNGSLEQKVIKGINLSLDSGFYVLKGASGSGKSTLLNLVGTLDKPNSGDIVIVSNNVLNMSDKELTSFRFTNIGFIFQQFNLIPVLNAFENVEYPLLKTKMTAKERALKVNKLLDMLGMLEFVKKKPSNLSGGQQQRVAIARSLVNSPKLLLADEPTASLDTENTINIIKLIKTLVDEEKLLAIISTHDEIVSQHTNSIIYMKDGVLVNADH